MNEAQEILLKSLQSYGISLHSNIFSIKDLTPDSIFSICAQFLLLIDNDPSSSSCFPPSLPSSMVDRFKICEDMAAAIKALGYRETLSFHQLKGGLENLENQEKMLIEAKHAKALEVQTLEDDYEILKVAVDMACNDRHSAEYFIKQLNEQVESRRHNIMELDPQRNCHKQTQEDREMTPCLASHKLEHGVQEKLEELKEIEQETEATISEINRRELEYSKLLSEFQKLPKIPPRKSYIERITEITKNSWKQDADIDRILKETRKLQLESNSIRERVDRTYVVVEESVFREAKKDAMGRQVYRLLTGMHDSFEQISEKILATDRARREAAEQEAKIATLASRSIDISKLQTDLDSIRKENEKLEQQLHKE